MKSVLDDISRDTYENSLSRQRIENFKDSAYERPPSYDQYQRERKEMLSDHNVTKPEAEMKK